MNTREFVAQGITKVFDELGDKQADELAEKHGADASIEALAVEVLKARMYMLRRWAEYVDDKDGAK